MSCTRGVRGRGVVSRSTFHDASAAQNLIVKDIVGRPIPPVCFRGLGVGAWLIVRPPEGCDSDADDAE